MRTAFVIAGMIVAYFVVGPMIERTSTFKRYKAWLERASLPALLAVTVVSVAVLVALVWWAVVSP